MVNMETKDKIKNSALTLFVKNGFTTPTASITKDAGVSTGVLFNYFNTKVGLIVELYTEIIWEYYSTATQVLHEIPQNDIKKYEMIVRASQNSMVNWGLSNWQKFQYIELFESSLLANQFSLKDNKKIEEAYLNFFEITRVGIKYGYLKNLPVDYLTEIGVVISAFVIKYLHKNPKYQKDQEFLDDIWQIQWNIIKK